MVPIVSPKREERDRKAAHHYHRVAPAFVQPPGTADPHFGNTVRAPRELASEDAQSSDARAHACTTQTKTAPPGCKVVFKCKLGCRIRKNGQARVGHKLRKDCMKHLRNMHGIDIDYPRYIEEVIVGQDGKELYPQEDDIDMPSAHHGHHDNFGYPHEDNESQSQGVHQKESLPRRAEAATPPLSADQRMVYQCRFGCKMRQLKGQYRVGYSLRKTCLKHLRKRHRIDDDFHLYIVKVPVPPEYGMSGSDEASPATGEEERSDDPDESDDAMADSDDSDDERRGHRKHKARPRPEEPTFAAKLFADLKEPQTMPLVSRFFPPSAPSTGSYDPPAPRLVPATWEFGLPATTPPAPVPPSTHYSPPVSHAHYSASVRHSASSFRSTLPPSHALSRHSAPNWELHHSNATPSMPQYYSVNA